MRRLILFLLTFLLAAVPLDANLVVPTAFREIVSDATLIVRGRVTDVRTVVFPDTGIETVATIAVDTVLKGQSGSFVSVRVPGGDTDRVRSVWSGAPRFRVSDQAVLFLKRGADGTWRTIDLSLGVYRISRDPATNRAVVAPPAVLGVNASPGLVVRGDSRRRLMPVQEFESLVRLVIAGRTSGQAVRR